MQVRFVESTIEPGHTRLIVQADGIETEIEGYGAGDYKLTIRACRNEDQPTADRTAAVAAFLADNPQATDASWWGTALVWAQPHTIAYLVRDVVRGQ